MNLLLVTIATLALTTAAGAQNTIQLRPAARAQKGADVTLADVATLDGPDAGSLGAIVVPTDTGANWTTIDAEMIRRVINDTGFNTGRYSLQGSSCAVRFAGARPKPATRRTARRVAPPTTPDAGTIQAAIHTHLSEILNVDERDLRLEFRTLDAQTLARKIGDERCEVQLTSQGSSERVQVRVLLFGGDAGDALNLDRTLIADVAIRRQVMIATHDLERRRPVTTADCTPVVQWINPGDARPIEQNELEHRIASRHISAGDVLTTRDIEAPVVVKKGDLVRVHCLNGRIAIEITARATTDGRAGQLIPFLSDGSKKTFMARVANHGGTAVLNMRASERSNGKTR